MPRGRRASPATTAVLGNVATLKAVESYNRGLLHIRQGRLEEAVLELLESIFYAPDNANPIVALAEVYVFLSDLQSAVQQYRRAVWVLTRRDRESRRAAAKRAAEAEREAFFANAYPQLVLFNGPPTAAASEGTPANAFANPVAAKEAQARAAVAIPDTTTSAAGEPQGEGKEPGQAFANDGGVQIVAVQVRLAGLLDALGMSLFRMNNFLQALRFCEEALDVLRDVTAAANSLAAKPPKKASLGGQAVKGSGNEAAAAEDEGEKSSTTTVFDLVSDELAPALELHRCVYLIALHREEEAEFRLEAHHKKHEKHRVQSGSLLIHLYVNRQAFRSARMMLEENTSAAIRQERVLTIAQHIFNEKYRRYRSKALFKRDLGTISQCIEVYPGDTDLLYARARIFIDSGELKRSVKDLFKCIKESNSTHKEAVNAMTEVLIQIGKDSSARTKKNANDDDDDDEGGRKSVEEAITYYSESLKWRADNTNVLLARADCYMRLENYEDALLDYRKMLQIDPDDLVAHQRVATLHDIWGRKLYSQGKVREAEREFTHAIKTDDRHALFFYHRALCRFELNEPRYGLRDVISCQQLNPTDPKLRAFIIRYLGSDEAPATLTPDNAPAPPSPTEVQAVVNRRSAALYGQPSARITKTIREVHDECTTKANNRGISEDVVRAAMLPASGRGAASSTHSHAKHHHHHHHHHHHRHRQLRVSGAHLTYKEFLAYQVAADGGDVDPLDGGGADRGAPPTIITGMRSHLQRRPPK